MAKKLKVLTPVTTDGKNLAFDDDNKPIYSESIMELGAKAELQSINATLPKQLQHKLEIVDIDTAEEIQFNMDDLRAKLAAEKATLEAQKQARDLEDQKEELERQNEISDLKAKKHQAEKEALQKEIENLKAQNAQLQAPPAPASVADNEAKSKPEGSKK